MNSLITVIQKKIEDSVINWNPEDLSLYIMLSPWKIIFTEDYFEDFINKFVLPKLNYLTSKIEINPKNQNIESIKILFIWSEIMSIKKLSEILLQNFFPKFVEIFKQWLFQKPKLEEILKWYEGWKKVFSNKNLLENSNEIQNIFKLILNLINNYMTKK
jgi:tuftelin-interacting protein 11